MPIRMSQVKELCTAAETALVQASRKPELEELSLSEVKRKAVRARKLFDKWQDQARRQARGRERKVGFGDSDSRSHVKEQIFSDALRSFEAQIAKLEKAGATGSKRSVAKPKSARAVKHRAKRADVRAELSEAKRSLNTKKKAARKSADSKTASKQTAAKAKAKTKSNPSNDTAAPEEGGQGPKKKVKKNKGPVVNPVTPASKKQRRAPALPAELAQSQFAGVQTKQAAVAGKVKRTPIKLSGLTTRKFGHVSARGKRSQARRDRRG